MRFLPCLLLTMILPPLQTASAQTLLAEKPEFHQLVPEGAVVEKLAGDFNFLEGPAWNAAGGFLVFSDIPADKMYRYDPATKAATVFREPSHNANGNFYDLHGNLFTCEHETRRVVETPGKGGQEIVFANGQATKSSTDGMVSPCVEKFEDKAFNSPNDVVVKLDGSVWFSDPTYGLGKRPKEQTANNVYCLERGPRRLRAVATDFVQPNGLCFSPDEKLLYIADSGHPPQQVRVFDVTDDNQLINGRVFCQIDQGVPDGMRCDRHGNLFSTAGDGIQIFAPDGTRLGKILVPETPANLCFGGRDGDELFITARTSLYHVKLTTSAPSSKAPWMPANSGH